MPFHQEKQGNKYVVKDDKGKTHGTHDTKKEAVNQVIAGNIAMNYVPGLKPRRSSTPQK